MKYVICPQCNSQVWYIESRTVVSRLAYDNYLRRDFVVIVDDDREEDKLKCYYSCNCENHITPNMDEVKAKYRE